MKLTNNTILITGGGSGIGLETAKLLAEKGNKIIIVGRNKEKLNRAVLVVPNATAIVSDITIDTEVDRLVTLIYNEFPELNILINNAGKAQAYSLAGNNNAFNIAREEILTNYLSTIRLTEKLLPLLKTKEEAAIINNSSVVAFVPAATLPTYSASKAALHSYTQSLRLVLQQTATVKVFEVMPPLVDTEFAKGITGNKISPALVAEAILTGLENNQYEIHVASTAALYAQYLSEPYQAFKIMNRLQ